MNRLRLGAVALLCAVFSLSAQSVRYDGQVTTTANNAPYGGQVAVYAVPFATVSVCNYNTSPCVPVTVYSDQPMQSPMNQPLVTDGQGHFGFWIPAGTYSYTAYSPSGNVLQTRVLTLSVGGSGAAPTASAIQAAISALTGCTTAGYVYVPASNACVASSSMTGSQIESLLGTYYTTPSQAAAAAPVQSVAGAGIASASNANGVWTVNVPTQSATTVGAIPASSAPAGQIVGTTDTQTLTNKTVDGVAPATMAYVAGLTSSAQTQLTNLQTALTAATPATVGSSGAPAVRCSQGAGSTDTACTTTQLKTAESDPTTNTQILWGPGTGGNASCPASLPTGVSQMECLYNSVISIFNGSTYTQEVKGLTAGTNVTVSAPDAHGIVTVSATASGGTATVIENTATIGAGGSVSVSATGVSGVPFCGAFDNTTKTAVQSTIPTYSSGTATFTIYATAGDTVTWQCTPSGSTVNAAAVGAAGPPGPAPSGTGVVYDTNGTAAAVTSVPVAQILPTGTAPTCTPGAAAGTGATCTVTGTNIAGVLTLTTGTGTSGNGTLATLTYSATLSAAPYGCSLQARNASAAVNATDIFTTAPTTTTWTLGDGAASPAVSTANSWSYECE